MKAHVEYTDTFGGEANYCWVERHEFDPAGMSELAIVRKAKKLCGLNGVKGRACWIGEMYEFRPYRCCTVMFITFRENYE
jgi:hypothetical protein